MKKRVLAAVGLAASITLSACASGGGNTGTTAAKTAAAVNQVNETATPETTAAANTEVNWPDGDVTVYLRGTAGGTTYLVSRQLTDWMGEQVGVNFVINNDMTGGGAVVAENCYSAKPDGQTLLVCGSEMVIGDLLGTFTRSLKADYTLLASAPQNNKPNYICAAASAPYDTLEEMIEWARRNPGKLKVQVNKNTIGEVYAKLLVQNFDIEVKYIEASGDDAKVGILGGLLDIGFFNQNVSEQYIGNGDYKALVSMSQERDTEKLTDIPSYGELGLGHMVVPSYMILVGPKNMDEAVANKINALSLEFAGQTEPNAFIQQQGAVFVPRTRAEVQEVVDEMYDKIGQVYGTR